MMSVDLITGSTAQNPRGVQRITITLHNETGAIDCDLDVRSLDEAVGMLHRALLQAEARVRFAMAQEIALENAQNAQLGRVAADVMRRGGRGV